MSVIYNHRLTAAGYDHGVVVNFDRKSTKRDGIKYDNFIKIQLQPEIKLAEDWTVGLIETSRILMI